MDEVLMPVVAETKSIPEEIVLIQKSISNVREEMRDNPYILEAVKVLRVQGYRSAIGCYWNAVVDDLRRKVMLRSLDLFNKEVKPKREIKTYEDFQDVLTDNDLIDGAYKIGVISWEARKMLHQARETRNIFDGHPMSSDPSPLKVLDMMNDCNKYVLSQEYPPAVIELEAYIQTMDSPNYERNVIAIEQAFSDLPEIYKTELANRFYTVYTYAGSSTTLRANVEVAAPILWQVLPKETRLQVAKRLDKDFVSGDGFRIKNGTEFLGRVGGLKYISTATRRAIYEPVLKRLEDSLDQWNTEAEVVTELQRLGTNIPADLVERYVTALTLTYVGYRGNSFQYGRTEFYSNGAAPVITALFPTFDDNGVRAFINAIKKNTTLRQRIRGSGQLRRLRNLANILLDRPSLPADAQQFLEMLVDEQDTGKFMHAISL